MRTRWTRQSLTFLSPLKMHRNVYKGCLQHNLESGQWRQGTLRRPLKGTSPVGIDVCIWWTHGILTSKHRGLAFFAERPAKAKDRKAWARSRPPLRPVLQSGGIPLTSVFGWGNWGSPSSFNLLSLRFFLLCDFRCPPRECPSILHAKRLVLFTCRVWPGPSHQLPGSHLHPSRLRVPLCNPQTGLRSSWSYNQTRASREYFFDLKSFSDLRGQSGVMYRFHPDFLRLWPL